MRGGLVGAGHAHLPVRELRQLSSLEDENGTDNLSLPTCQHSPAR
jgi:hypothetical protein